MGDEYVCAGGRKSKCDKRAKGRFMRYKRGGAFRSANVRMTNAQREKKKK